jgi:hypothetical protein
MKTFWDIRPTSWFLLHIIISFNYTQFEAVRRQCERWRFASFSVSSVLFDVQYVCRVTTIKTDLIWHNISWNTSVLKLDDQYYCAISIIAQYYWPSSATFRRCLCIASLTPVHHGTARGRDTLRGLNVPEHVWTWGTRRIQSSASLSKWNRCCTVFLSDSDGAYCVTAI